MFSARNYHLLLFLGQQLLIASCLRVTPGTIDQAEGDSQVHFFCFEGPGSSSYATGIAWSDPQGYIYTPGSPSEGGNERIEVQGSQLTVRDLIRTDGGSYECFRISDDTDSGIGTLFVYAPPAILNPMPIQEIYHGVTSLLTCQVDRGNPLASITWVHIARQNQTDPDSTVYTVITDDYDPRFTIVENGLEIANVQEGDEAIYRCYVHNEHGTKRLDIQAAFRASPQFVDQGTELTVVLGEGESASLDCTAAGAPSPNITWSGPPHSQIAELPPWTGAILDVQLADELDAGDYSCSVDNGVGMVTRTFSVKIAVPPNPVRMHWNLTIELDRPTRINCSVSAVPKAEFQWINTATHEAFPDVNLSSFHGDGIGHSQFTHTFTADDFKTGDCRIVVMCLATNPYGRSEQYFTLSPSDRDNSCPRDETETTTTPSRSTPSVSLASDQGLGESGGEEKPMDGSTFKIIIAVFAIALTSIVAGVFILLLYFLKHFCHRKKECISAENSIHKHRSDSVTSSLHHEQMTSGGPTPGRLASIDSGVSSVNSMQALLPGHGSISGDASGPQVPTESIYSGISQELNTSIGNESSDGIYHHLNHNPIPHNHSSSLSFASGIVIAPSPSRRMARLSSNSSANSNLHLLPQSSSSTACSVVESSITSAGSVFFSNWSTAGPGGAVGGGGAGGDGDGSVPLSVLRPPPPLPRWKRSRSSSSSTTTTATEHRQCDSDRGGDDDGCGGGGVATSRNSSNPDSNNDEMQVNLAYETRKQKFSVSSSEEAPHVYELVA